MRRVSGSRGIFHAKRFRAVSLAFSSLESGQARTCSNVFTSLHRKHALVCFTNSRGGSAALSNADAIVSARRVVCIDLKGFFHEI